MGAWIETIMKRCEVRTCRSHPTWVRGLKLIFEEISINAHAVAPYVGAWIETRTARRLQRVLSVAPYVGAWIETVVGSLGKMGVNASHPTWVRGLKPFVSNSISVNCMSHPTWVRGLKPEGFFSQVAFD